MGGQIATNVAYVSDDGGVVSAPVLGPSVVLTHGAWASSTTDVWIGTPNKVAHMTAGGTTTTSSLGGFPSHFWGVSDTDVYAIYGSGLLHFDGSNWSFVVGAGQLAVWGSGASDVFAVGALGFIQHWNGTTWSDQASGTTVNLYDVWGSAPNDVFAVGSGGTVLHYDGSVWASMVSGLSTDLSLVTGTGPDDVFIVDMFGTARHYDGTAWLPLRLPSTGRVIAVAATAAAFYVVTDEPAVYRLLRTAPWP